MLDPERVLADDEAGDVLDGADAGADPRAHPNIAAWLDRVEATPGFVNDLEPVPAHVAERPL